MRRLACVICIVLVLAVGTLQYSLVAAQAESGKLPAPCKLDSTSVYLVVDGLRRHINNWDTFVNLGYAASDIVPCGEAKSYPEGAPISRLIKGTADPVYWMENGHRRHIPDMATFDAWGFKTSEISLLPDSLVALWPPGDALPVKANTSYVQDEMVIGPYTIQVIYQRVDTYNLYHATIAAPGQPTITITDIYKIGKLPAVDITGEGDADVLFLREGSINYGETGTVVFNLGTVPTRVLDIGQLYHMDAETGLGEFKDLNGDGVYEFITTDRMASLCGVVNIPVVLQYNPAMKRYGSANREFPAFFEPQIARDTAGQDTRCNAIAALLYLGREAEAATLFNNLFPHTDAEHWTYFVNSIKSGRFYTPGS